VDIKHEAKFEISSSDSRVQVLRWISFRLDPGNMIFSFLLLLFVDVVEEDCMFKIWLEASVRKVPTISSLSEKSTPYII